MTRSDWRPLGSVDLRVLSEARVQTHYAVQWLGRVARAYVPGKPDDSHTNLGWDSAFDGLVTHPLPDGTQFGMSISTLTLALSGQDGAIRAARALTGRKNAEAHAWLGEHVRSLNLDPASLDARSPWAMPPHSIGDGAAYDGDNLADARNELAAWFANADLALGRIEADYTGKQLTASPVRCWPHHFDIATLVSLDGGDPEHARSVNAGLSPGDGSYDEPYFYVSPWPYPEVAKLPPIPIWGHWHTEGFLAAVAPATRIVGAATPQKAAEEFLDAAVAAAIKALA